MKTYTLRNGDTIPSIGLGTWQAAPGQVEATVTAAIEFGYRHIDCASIYANEKEIGNALNDVFQRGKVTRDELWITSKLWNDAHESHQVASALKKTLADLRLDYLDLYLIHWPVAVQSGIHVPETPDQYFSLDELPLAVTWSAMHQCVKQGLCKHIGVSNFSAKKLSQLAETASLAPEVNQVEMHPYLQQPALVEFCRNYNILLTAYSPLGSPSRPDGMKRAGEPNLWNDPTLADIAAKHGASVAQILISWALYRGTIAIPKTVHPHRLKENLSSTEIKLDAHDISSIAPLDKHYRFVDGSFWEMPGGPYTAANVWDE